MVKSGTRKKTMERLIDGLEDNMPSRGSKDAGDVAQRQATTGKGLLVNILGQRE
jgi:hypothetical protein